MIHTSPTSWYLKQSGTHLWITVGVSQHTLEVEPKVFQTEKRIGGGGGGGGLAL